MFDETRAVLAGIQGAVKGIVARSLGMEYKLPPPNTSVACVNPTTDENDDFDVFFVLNRDGTDSNHDVTDDPLKDIFEEK